MKATSFVLCCTSYTNGPWCCCCGHTKNNSLSNSFSNKLATPFISDRRSSYYGSPPLFSLPFPFITLIISTVTFYIFFYGTHNVSTIIFYHPLSTLSLSLSHTKGGGGGGQGNKCLFTAHTHTHRKHCYEANPEHQINRRPSEKSENEFSVN